MASEEPPGTSGLSASDDLDPGSASFPQLENLPQELHDMVYNDAAEFATLNRILKLFFGGDFSIWIEPGSKTSFAHCKYVCSKAGLSKFRSYIANSVKIDSDREIRSFPYNPQKDILYLQINTLVRLNPLEFQFDFAELQPAFNRRQINNIAEDVRAVVSVTDPTDTYWDFANSPEFGELSRQVQRRQFRWWEVTDDGLSRHIKHVALNLFLGPYSFYDAGYGSPLTNKSGTAWTALTNWADEAVLDYVEVVEDVLSIFPNVVSFDFVIPKKVVKYPTHNYYVLQGIPEVKGFTEWKPKYEGWTSSKIALPGKVKAMFAVNDESLLYPGVVLDLVQGLIREKILTADWADGSRIKVRFVTEDS